MQVRRSRGQFLFYRELGFPLEEVAELLDDPDADPHAHLRRQHELLTAGIGKLREMATAVEHAMEARKMGINLTPEEKFAVFGDFDPDEHAAEAERRWGDTDAYQESQRRTAAMTKEDWKRSQEEFGSIHQRLADQLDRGAAADSEASMDLAEGHRLAISRTFYECGHEMHTNLGEMYVADDRFAANYEQIRPGLAAYFRDAITANAVRNV